VLALFVGPLTAWWVYGERFLARTQRVPAEALVVEGWIGIEGVEAAAAEFTQGGYQYLITTGGPTKSRWTSERWDYAIEARKLLLYLKVPSENVIVASAPDADNQRTFQSALAVRQALEQRGLHLNGINVLTLGAHARRSRLIFAKVLGPGTTLGAISWRPSDYKAEPWWKSSERAQDLLKETVGWLFELGLNSGRTSNRPAEPESLAH